MAISCFDLKGDVFCVILYGYSFQENKQKEGGIN